MVSIAINGLTKVYRGLFSKPVEAIKGITFSVEQGEIFGFLGPNGAGKTTTLKILSGLLYPTGGSAEILGKPIDDIAHRQTVGFLPEHPSFYQHLSGRELLHFYGSIFGLRSRELNKRVDYVLDLVELTEAQHMRIGSYSKGMIQRIGIAQSLVNDPALIVLDEPLSGLDPTGRKRVKDILLSLKAQGRTVFFSTHILADVEKICDRMAILRQGRLIKVGSLDELMKEEVQSTDITLEGATEKHAVALERFSSSIIKKDRKVFLTVDSPEGVREVQEFACRNKCRIVSLIPHLRTLEDYFSHIVSLKDEDRS